jgi:hypothetical protein
MKHPKQVIDGIRIVKDAIEEERRKNYGKARKLYIEAATLILKGAKLYKKGSAEEVAATGRAQTYADRADSLLLLQQQQRQSQSKQSQPSLNNSPGERSKSTSQLYQSPPSNFDNSQENNLLGERKTASSGTTDKSNRTSYSANKSTLQPSLNNPPSEIHRVPSLKYQAPPSNLSHRQQKNSLEKPLISGTDESNHPSYSIKKSILFTKTCLILTIVVVAISAACVVLFIMLSNSAPNPSVTPTPSGSHPEPAPGPVGPSTPSPSASQTCGPGPKWQLWKGMTDKSAWYDYIDVNVPVSKLPVTGIMSSGEKVELELDIDMGGTSKRSSQLYANPEFQQHYDNLIREWNPSASTRSGTVDSCGFPIGEKADTSTPSLEDFKRETCFYEDFNDGLNLASLRPLEQKACCERGPDESTVGCWIWSNGTDYPRGCSESGGGYKFNGNIGIEEMDVVYPHNTKPRKKNVLRLTSRNDDADICNNPFTNPADKKKLCHKIIKSSGLVQTNDMYASARFDVVAKVPADRGLVWAIWTFHQEQHVPGKLGCENYTCYADGFPGGQLGNETTIGGSAEVTDDQYMFTPRTRWDDCCDSAHCCLDPTPPLTNNMFLRAMKSNSYADQCPIPKSERTSNSTCACCRYNLDNDKFPHHKYNAPCCIASKQKIGPCTGPSTCDKDYYTDARSTKCQYGKDPQWLRNASMVSWLNKINHEIDIEIPASCYDSEVCGVSAGQCGLDIEDGKWCNTTLRDKTGCVKQFNTMNANNYRITTTGGTGHAYTNMCLKANKKVTTKNTWGEETSKQEPFMLAGDGQYHKYTIDWHTGGPDCEARVDFYVDDVLLATNNVMVPTRGSRFVFGSWGPNKGDATSTAGKFNNEWTNFPDFWGNGVPGDGKSYLSHVYVSEVKITPHNEPNDIMYPATLDRKDGCEKIFGQEKNSCHQHWETDEELGWKDAKIPPKMKTGAAPGSMGKCVK